MAEDFRKRSRDMYDEALMRKSVDYLAPQHQVPLIIQQSLTFDSIDGQNFPYKLWFIINNPQFGDVLHWSQDGTAIVFPDDKLFLQKILKRKEGKIFKTESLKSFVRQLNLYGFRKVMSDRYDGIGRSKFGSMFDHEYFIRGRPDLLEYVKRRCNVKLGQKESDTTPSANLASVLNDRSRVYSYQSGMSSGERLPKRRLRFSPEGKENQLNNSPVSNADVVNDQSTYQTPTSVFSGFFSTYQGYPLTNQLIGNSSMPGLAAAEDSVPFKMASPTSNKPGTGQQSIVTIPKSAMFPTPSHARTGQLEGKPDGNRISLADTLASILSPATPSEIAQVTAAYLTTPTSLSEQSTSFISPTNALNFYATTGPSPLSALCASLFSPFTDSRSAIHKATQTSGEPKEPNLFTDDAAVRTDTSCQTFDEFLKQESGAASLAANAQENENYYVMEAVSSFQKENVIKESEFMTQKSFLKEEKRDDELLVKVDVSN